MMTISRQDVLKTLIIVWFIGTTGYVAYDLYAGYKIRGMQTAYSTGYQKSVDDLIKKTTDSKCQPVEIQKDGSKLQLIDLSCIQQQGQAGDNQAPTATGTKPPAK